MITRHSPRLRLVALLVLLTGCASSQEAQERARAQDEDIATILSQPLDRDEYGETRRCLSPYQIRDVRILDDQRILFEGPRGKLWLNTLRMRCPDLRRDSVLRVRTWSPANSICDLDSFAVADWFDWPWYRRWWGSGIRCTLGSFQPVTQAQADALVDALRPR